MRPATGIGRGAVDLDQRFDGGNLCLPCCIALEPADPRELAEGVMVY
jgi:hypothetical protein